MPSITNPNVTIPGSGVLLHVLNTSGEPIPVQGDNDGAINTSGGGGGGGGTVDQGTAGIASWKVVEDNSAAIKAAVEKIPAQGQALAGASAPVVLPLSQAAGPLALQSQLPAALSAGGGVKVGLVDALPAGGNSIGTIVSTNAAASQADGHSASIGSTADADSALTLIGRIKNLLSRIPAALVGGRFDTVIGAALPAGTNVIGKIVGQNAVGGTSTVNPVSVGGVIAGDTTTTIFWTDSSGRQMAVGPVAVGTAATTNPLLGGGKDAQGFARAALLDYRGAAVSAAANMGGDIMTSSRVAVCRGISSEGQSFNLFSKREAGSGTVTYNATTGRYDCTTTVAALDSAIHVHNSKVHYVENNPYGVAITARLSSTTTTNKRIEFGMMAATATTGTNFLTADRFGFYVENGVLGVFAYSTITGAYLFQVAQSLWTDPLNGSGQSKRTFTYATALLNQFKLEANQVWLGSDDMEFAVNDVVVYTRDFKFGNPTENPTSRVPHMRPYVAHHNTGVAAASTVSVNCLEGVRMTQQLPIGRQFTSARNTARTSLASATEVPVYALRVNSTTKARQFLLERFTARSASQAVRVRCYLGRASDFLITGGTWETPDNNRGTLMEENKGNGGEMSWSHTAANLNKIVDDVILSAADVTKEYDTETYFEEGFPLKGDAWLGIDGDGEQRLIVWTATSEAGANGQLNILNVHGREIG